MVGAIDAGRIVDGVGVQPDAPFPERDPPGLGDAEIGPLADHLGADLRRVDADGVIGLVADIEMALLRRLDVGADAAEIEQLDARLQDGLHQVERRQFVRVEVQHRLDLRRQRDRLLAA